jgi:hypothetical protein
MMLLFITAFTVLQWGVVRWGASEGRRAWLIWAGQAGVLLTAIVMRVPWLVIVTAGLLLAPSLRLTGSKSLPGSAQVALRDSMPWWWAGTLATALALRV